MSSEKPLKLQGFGIISAADCCHDATSHRCHPATADQRMMFFSNITTRELATHDDKRQTQRDEFKSPAEHEGRTVHTRLHPLIWKQNATAKDSCVFYTSTVRQSGRC